MDEQHETRERIHAVSKSPNHSPQRHPYGSGARGSSSLAFATGFGLASTRGRIAWAKGFALQYDRT